MSSQETTPASPSELSSVTRVIVGEKDTVGAMVPGMPFVAATPYLVAIAEGACTRLVKDQLEPGQITVGTRVVIDHLGPSKVGAELVIKATLLEREKEPSQICGPDRRRRAHGCGRRARAGRGVAAKTHERSGLGRGRVARGRHADDRRDAPLARPPASLAGGDLVRRQDADLRGARSNQVRNSPQVCRQAWTEAGRPRRHHRQKLRGLFRTVLRAGQGRAW